MLRENLCTLPNPALQELAMRLGELADHIHDVPIAADLRQAARAVSDLASTRLALEEIAGECRDREAAKELFELIGREAPP